MRLDLADVGEDVDRTADLAVRHLEQQRAEGAIILAIGEPLDLGRRLVLATEARLVRVRPVAGGWATDDRYWVSMAGGSPRGYAYRRSLDHPAAAQAVWEGQEIASSRAAIEATMAPLDGDRLDEVEAMADRVLEDLLSQCGPDADTQAGVQAHLANDVAPALEDLRDGKPVSDARLLRMAFLVTRTKIRDEAWGLITLGQCARLRPRLAACGASRPARLGTFGLQLGRFRLLDVRRRRQISDGCRARSAYRPRLFDGRLDARPRHQRPQSAGVAPARRLVGRRQAGCPTSGSRQPAERRQVGHGTLNGRG